MNKKLRKHINWLQSKTRSVPKENLDFLRNVYDSLSIDLSEKRKIHITGTNGKGSTASFINQVLMKNNRVGLFTSPFLLSFNERIRVNNENISDKNLLKLLIKMKNLDDSLIKEHGHGLTFFEMLTLMALKHFADENVSYIIMEVGIGGLLDSTNIIDYDLSIITSIGFDHENKLGQTIELILMQKLGIVKNKTNHLIASVASEHHDQISKHIFAVGASFDINVDHKLLISDLLINKFEFESNIYELSLLGQHQISNAILAIKAVNFLDSKIKYSDIFRALKETKWSGRLEKIRNNPSVYLDGAHNISAINELVNFFKNNQKGRLFILFSALGDKNIAEMILSLKMVSSRITLTTFPDPRLASFAKIIINNPEISIIPDFELAYNLILKEMQDNDILLITGSLHFVGYVKTIIK